ncbi:BTAD domain-containing putative transcriptional regulator [Spirillospora sp. NPDC052269]
MRIKATRIIRAVLAQALLAVLLIGAPLGLLAAAGSPVPGHVPDLTQVSGRLLRPDDGTLLLDALKLIAWAAWTAFAIAVATDIIARLRGLSAVPRLPGLGAPQRLAASLVTAAVLGAGGPAMASSATAGTPPPVTLTTPPHELAPPGHVQAPASAGLEALRQGDGYEVEPGDTLSGIAEHHLGDASRWRQVWHLNQDRRQPDGEVASDPDLIRPGWKLRLPHTTNPRPTPHPHPAHKAPPSRPKPSPSPAAATRQPGPTPAPATPTRTHLTPSPEREDVRAPVVAPFPRIPDKPPNAKHTPDHDQGIERGSGNAVSLPSGSMLALSFAAGITTALAATRLRRRRRHITPPASHGVQITPEPAAEPAVHHTSQAHRRLEAHDPDSGPPPTDYERVRAAFTINALTQIAVGVRPDGSTLELDLSGLILGLDGPGAQDVARALALAVLNDSGHHRARLLIAAADAEALFGPAALGLTMPGLKILPTPDAVAQRITRELRTRSAMAASTHASGIDDLRAGDPGEPLPTIVTMGSFAKTGQNVVRGLPDAGCQGVGSVLLPAPVGAPTCTISTDGTVTSATGPLAHVLQGSTLFLVTEDDAPELLRIINAGDAALDPEIDDVPDGSPNTDERPMFSEEGDILVASGNGPTSREPAQTQPIHLRVLGRPRLEAEASVSLSARGKAMELLIYLALHPEGATRDELCAALWPDIDPGDRFHSTLRHLRDALRDTVDSPSRFVYAESERYRIDRTAISVDLWNFHAALADTRNARTDHERVSALQRASALCRGELAEGAYYEWLDEHRYPATRAQCDALVQLAELSESEGPEGALQMLESARDLDPDNEEVYRRIIQIQVGLGRTDAAKRTLHLLRKRLHEIGLEPERETLALLETTRHTRHQPGVSGRPR